MQDMNGILLSPGQHRARQLNKVNCKAGSKADCVMPRIPEPWFLQLLQSQILPRHQHWNRNGSI